MAKTMRVEEQEQKQVKNGNNDETKSTTLVRLFRFFMTVKLVL